jgi:biopolymer transport protein ExbB/TolQ
MPDQITHFGVLVAEGVLVLFSLLSVAALVERVITLWRKQAAEARDYVLLREAFRKGRMDLVRERVLTSGAPCSLILGAGLRCPDRSLDGMRGAMEMEISVQCSRLLTRLRVLATIASTAPFVGLFGTVLGILAAFQKIAATGQTGATVVAGGISEALVTTIAGLGVAVPSVIFYNWLLGHANDLGLIIETHARDLEAFLAAQAVKADSITVREG